MSRLRILGGPGFYPGRIQLCKPPLPELSNITERLTATLSSGILTKGTELAAFEAEVADTMGVEFAFGVSSCTVGLALILAAHKMARGVRLEKREKILVPSFTFLATATASMWAGYDPIFVDSDLRTYNVIVSDLEKKLDENNDISAIIFTHVFGSPSGIDQVLSAAKKRDIPVVFDSAHGFGILHSGKPVGSQGLGSSFSMTPTKLLTSGEGGFITTNDEQMALNIRILREYGTKPGAHDTVFPGLNGRMSEIHAIIGRWGLTQVEKEAEARNHFVKKYKDKLSGVGGLSYQCIADDDRCSYKDFGIRIDAEKFGLTRDQLIKVMDAENIECKTYFYPPVHSHEYFKSDTEEDSCPNATRLSHEMICPPLFGSMSDAQIKAVSSTIIAAHENAEKLKEIL